MGPALPFPMRHLRPALLLALASAALSAHAEVAFSNKPAGDYLASGFGIGPETRGYQFASTATGLLTGFDVSVNNGSSSDHRPFTLKLYADAGGTLGTLLGSFAGLSSGLGFYSRTSGYESVAAGGVVLRSGASYWLVASSPTRVIWQRTERTWMRSLIDYDGSGNYYYGTSVASIFSVNVDPSVTSIVPGPAAALPFALMALRRRKRA